MFDGYVYLRGKLCIVDQMQKRLEEKLLQEEVKEQEGQHMLENVERMQVEELKVHACCQMWFYIFCDWFCETPVCSCLSLMLSQAIERKKEDQRKLLQEIQKINEGNLVTKEQKKEEERLADLRAAEYTKKKLVRKV